MRSSFRRPIDTTETSEHGKLLRVIEEGPEIEDLAEIEDDLEIEDLAEIEGCDGVEMEVAVEIEDGVEIGFEEEVEIEDGTRKKEKLDFSQASKLPPPLYPPPRLPSPICNADLHNHPSGPKGVHIEVFRSIWATLMNKAPSSRTTMKMVSEVVLPTTDGDRLAYIDLQRIAHGRAMDGAPLVADATCFISHAWASSFGDIVDCANQFESMHPRTYFWFDAFCNNQHTGAMRVYCIGSQGGLFHHHFRLHTHLPHSYRAPFSQSLISHTQHVKRILNGGRPCFVTVYHRLRTLLW